jgi:uncharacterized protein (DUF427 family)
VTEPEVAGRIDEPGDDREHEHQRWQRAVTAVARRVQRVENITPDAQAVTVSRKLHAVIGRGVATKRLTGPGGGGGSIRRMTGMTRRARACVSPCVENVWDYPRPPAVVPCERRVRVEVGRQVLAESTRALRVLETSHPPTIYVPIEDVGAGLLAPSDARSTWCEFKGVARYLDAAVADRRIRAVAWTYPDPAPGYEALRDHVAFYPARVDGAWLGDELVVAQHGDFYGGWITASDLIGPFKGPPGTRGW